MAVALGLESLLKDEIAVGVVGNHDIWFPQRALTGKWPVSSVYSLLGDTPRQRPDWMVPLQYLRAWEAAQEMAQPLALWAWLT